MSRFSDPISDTLKDKELDTLRKKEKEFQKQIDAKDVALTELNVKLLEIKVAINQALKLVTHYKLEDLISKIQTILDRK